MVNFNAICNADGVWICLRGCAAMRCHLGQEKGRAVRFAIQTNKIKEGPF